MFFQAPSGGREAMKKEITFRDATCWFSGFIVAWGITGLVPIYASGPWALLLVMIGLYFLWVVKPGDTVEQPHLAEEKP